MADNPVEIRAVSSADREGWQALWEGYQAFYEADLSAGTDELWERLLSDDAASPICLLALHEGEIVGLVHYLFHGSTWSSKQRIYLNDLFTSPSARGKGVGRALIEAVYKAADDNDAETVYWLTQDFNADGRRLYDKVAKLTPFIKYQR